MPQARKSNEFQIVSNYKLAYRNHEDVTNLPPGVMIVGSQNVLTNEAERIEIRKGYLLDGPSASVEAPILSSFDWLTKTNGEVHLRGGNLTFAGNDGKLQYRYVDSSGVVTWRDLLTNQSSVDYNFATFWNTTEALREVLIVKGSPQIEVWNGATAEVLIATSSTVTKSGTDTWLDSGFYASTSPRTIVINNSSYTYTGGESTLTLTGISPSISGVSPGDVVHQGVITVLNSTFTSGPPSTFNNALIANLNNQIYLGSLQNATVWISNVSNYTDYSQSTPRQTGEGATLILDDNIVAFKPQENFMYVWAGQDLAYNINFEIQTSTVGVTYEQVNALPLKTGRQQAAKSQALVSHMKNDIIMLTNEPTIDTLGRIASSLVTPQQTNLSDPIKIDIDSYDFTDASIFYYRYNIYVAVPRESIVLVYSLSIGAWQPPQILPISRFYIVDGELYGHSYATSESYKLFTGYADRVYDGFAGHPINAKAVFSYQNYGTRFAYKSANSLFIEGYISPNTTLMGSVIYELDGCQTVREFEIDGSDTQIVCIPSDTGSLGKVSLGKQKLGGTGVSSIQGLPPKFRVEKTFNNTDFFESSFAFEVLGVDQRFELLSFGLNAAESTQETVKIRQ